MKIFWTAVAISALVFGGAVHAGAPLFPSETGVTEEACFGQSCGNMAHEAMPVAECVAHCLQSGIETFGSAVFSFAGQTLPVFLAAFLGVIFILVSLRAAWRDFRVREYFSKLFLETSLRSVILLN